MTPDPTLVQARFRTQLGGFALDAAFETPAKGVTGVFGPSGSGKSSLLRCIAGLHRAQDGFLSVAGEIWQGAGTFLKAHQRPIGYVFQEASLFPHLDVSGNLAFGAPRRIDFAHSEIVGLLGLEALLGRNVQTLSGGERQRVAIGRALFSEPRLLLMDEPLSALDRDSRAEILPFLERLHRRLSLPVIYVSHDIGEIERLADHLVLMRDGRVIGSGPLAVVQADPSLPLASSRDAAVSYDAVVEAYDAHDGILTLRIDGGHLLVPSGPANPGYRPRIRIGAGDVSLSRSAARDSSILNVLTARIVSHRPLGPREVVAVLGLGAEGEGARLLARVTRRSWDQLRLQDGEAVFAQVKGVALAWAT